jgi:hypothetical protein
MASWLGRRGESDSGGDTGVFGADVFWVFGLVMGGEGVIVVLGLTFGGLASPDIAFVPLKARPHFLQKFASSRASEPHSSQYIVSSYLSTFLSVEHFPEIVLKGINRSP